MFCQNCGNEIKTGGRFCEYCGNEIFDKSEIKSNSVNSAVVVSQAAKSAEKSVFNRDVLENYLYNVKVLEFAKHKLEKDQAEILGRQEYLQRKNYKVYRKTGLADCKRRLVTIAVLLAVVIFGAWLIADISDSGLMLALIGVVLVVAMLALTAFGFMGYNIYKIITEIYHDRIRYDREVDERAEERQRDNIEKQKLSRLINVVSRDLRNTEHSLFSAYSMNIIPSKYRNLYGAYFLHEYISTSHLTLSEALFHCDLDEISQKLNQIMDKEEEVILQLARSNALSEVIINQNEQMLHHAKATEHNTALAAQYAQAAAVNAQTTANVQSYYFYKNGL